MTKSNAVSESTPRAGFADPADVKAEVSDIMRLGNLVMRIREKSGDTHKLTVHKAVREMMNGWRCFYCNSFFTTAEDAASHFGRDQHEPPKCIDAAQPETGVRERTIEECAKIAEQFGEEHGSRRIVNGDEVIFGTIANTADDIAETIRALSTAGGVQKETQVAKGDRA